MRRLDRTGIVPSADWDKRLKRNLPDRDAFFAKEAALEALDLNDPVRRKGFSAFAPEVLKQTIKGHGFPVLWGAAKKTLAAMSHHKCAYCESPINAERSAHVEHFRPKSLFPSLCYDWENYFLSCNGCNGQKSDKWPAQGDYVRPDEGEPASRFLFSRDGGVEAVPGDAEAENTIRDLGLDRAWLCRCRRLALGSVLEDIEDTFGLLAESPELEEAIMRLIDKQVARIAGKPELAYSTALLQCVQHALKQTRAERSAVPKE
ncbi:retron system putative HNH endonuclease [uncultured Thiodictyon sp.]|uniref:retron system putative HNH endonuclease n=1 Tax=uncultured Thiodictyon sp. TaxID=1846217 RepID=UPI0025F2CDE3|nr:retron system putative HNH endonuclease [uncultured Thiodictyon sp.]